MQLTQTKGFAPATITEAIQFSEMLAKSQMVPKQYQNKPEDIMVAVQWGYEIGLAPLQALQNISVINGKPSVYGDAAMALVQASPVCEGIEETIEGEGTPNPVAVCIAKRKGRSPVVAKFSVEDAKRAGLWGKQGPWQAYPKRMMQMRARGFALRDAFPDVLKGLITAEEAHDYPAERDVTPKAAAIKANPLEALAPPAPVTSVTTVTTELETDPQQEYVEVEEANQQLQEMQVEEVADAPLGEQMKAVVEAAGIKVASVSSSWLLMVPGKTEPISTHASLDEWSDAYEAIAEKTARAGKVPPAERADKIKALRKVNESVLGRFDATDRIKHTAAYSRRLGQLGASMEVAR